jgi:nitroreductase
MQEHVRSQAAAKLIETALAERFGEVCPVDPNLQGLDELARIAGHRVHRRFLPRPIEPNLLRLICACALSAPSKSDLQQADILVVRDKTKQRAITALIPDMPWIADAPVFLVFLADASRLPQIARLRNKPFPNDHLDLLFNAVADSAIVLTTFMRAAAAVGLGCCPISAVRDRPDAVSELLELPQRVIPLAGLCLGWPAEEGAITPRLDLSITLHEDRYRTGDIAGQDLAAQDLAAPDLAAQDLAARIEAYDRRREQRRPYRRQRDPERWGKAEVYGWSEDKARQYAEPLRADFGTFVRAKGFRLE